MEYISISQPNLGRVILKILCDLATTVEDSIPRYCEKHGYKLESVWIEDKDYWELYIQKP